MKYLFILAFVLTLSHTSWAQDAVEAEETKAQPETLAPPAVEDVEDTVKAAVSKAFGVEPAEEGEGEGAEAAENKPDFIPLTEQRTIRLTDQDGYKHEYTVGVARTREEMKNGLMWREYMPHDEGMLFAFKDDDIRTFWMKNTYIPLDMLFLDKEGRILHIHENAIPQDETRVSSKVPARMVLELNAGQVEKLGLRVGSIIEGLDFTN